MIVSRAKAVEAASVLGVELDTLTAESLKKAYRDAAKKCHPDHHGTALIQDWSRVSWANEVLGHWLKTHPSQDLVEAPQIVVENACRACGGTGRVPVARSSFGRPLTMMCVLCEGTGEIIRREEASE